MPKTKITQSKKDPMDVVKYFLYKFQNFYNNSSRKNKIIIYK